jgi:hypothetical protein
MTDERGSPTMESIREACEASFIHLNAALDRLTDPLPTAVEDGEWNLRQVLAHQIGVLFRTPIQAAFYSVVPEDGSLPVVPVVLSDPFWLEEWEHAPIAAFRNALVVAYFGNLAVLDGLDPASLSFLGQTPFGPMPLSDLLLGSYRHAINDHTEQFESLLSGVAH